MQEERFDALCQEIHELLNTSKQLVVEYSKENEKDLDTVETIALSLIANAMTILHFVLISDLNQVKQGSELMVLTIKVLELYHEAKIDLNKATMVTNPIGRKKREDENPPLTKEFNVEELLKKIRREDNDRNS